ncbi:porin [Candidatus Kuenenia stuttgartiensis]|uniref:Porin n=1 Tax=Kuenenia stuttgartiensis TaxID=174633 RepID=A0A6G7GNU6_KUEST|nr:porin [Candidatus Kuenenia stuttgartiensis]MBE7548799.1 porin [Planctomycetia bacterium]QII11268.1 porin [Candidatus Kuenenia stuttgartiensis]
MIGRKWRNFMLPNFFVFCVLCMGGVSPIVFAQGESSTDARSEVEELKQQLKLMEEAFARQQEQMDVLKNRIEIISTETKVVVKEETKQAVQDYFSTDEAKEILGVGMPDMIVEYTPDDKKSALSIRTTDGNYSLNIGALLQMQYEYKDKDDDFDESDTQNIDIRRARLNFGGNIYSKDLHYYIGIDGDKFDVGVRDFYVYWTPFDELNTKIGYFKVPFNRQRLASSATLLLQERSIASEFFDQDRDYGVDLYGKPFDGYMEYHAAVFQGAGEDQADWFQGKDNFDNELMFVLNARYNPFGKYNYYDETDLAYSDTLKATIGASVAFNGKRKDVKEEDYDNITGVVDCGLVYKGISWNNEYYLMSRDPESGGESLESEGFHTQLGYFVLPKKLELAGRYSVIDPDDDISNDIQREYTFGVNYYFRGHRSKIQADFGHLVTEGEEEDKEENRVRVQYQIMF